jgi:hypothetical protein
VSDDDIPQDQSGNCAAERDREIYEFCSEACRAALERPTG